MSVQQTHFVMIGKHFYEIDFDDEKVDALMDNEKASMLEVIGVDPMTDSSCVIGVIIAACDSEDDDTGLEEISFDYDKEAIQTLIIENGFDCLIEEVKIYSFNQYC